MELTQEFLLYYDNQYFYKYKYILKNLLRL